MQFICPIYLCKKQHGSTTNDIGESTETLVEKKVYASEESAKRTEFYSAQANGYKIEKVMTVRKFEYGNEEIVKIEGVAHTVMRTFDKQDGNIELALIKGVNTVVAT